MLIHFLYCIWTCKLNEIIDKKHLRKVESQQGKVWMKNNGMLEWQNVFLWDWTCNDLSDKNPIFPHVSLACHECGYTTHSSSMSSEPYLLLLFVCFLVTSNWMQQLKFNVHYAHSKLKSLPMGQIILPRNILKKALGLLQVDFFFLTQKMTYSAKNIYWTIMKSAKSLNSISHSMADDNIQHVQFSSE